MRGEHGHRACRHFVELVNENGAAGAQILDHVAVMHDFMPHIDRRAELDEGALHDVDGALHAGAKAAWLRQDHANRFW